MFTDTQVKQLSAKLDPKHVKTRDQRGVSLSYIEGWHAIDEANRIFGHGEWSRETIELTENTLPTKNQKGNHVVSFRAKVRVKVNGATREGVGFGSGIASDIHAAYESAIKEAETDAMKRALMTFGNPFGLALYDKTQSGVGVEEADPAVYDLQYELCNTINEICELDALEEFWAENKESAQERLGDIFLDVENLCYLPRVDAIKTGMKNGGVEPGPHKFRNVAAMDKWMEQADMELKRCDTLAELEHWKWKNRPKVHALEKKRKATFVEAFEKRIDKKQQESKPERLLEAG